MGKPARHLIKGFLLLGITSVLWVTALLFRFRIVNIFDAYLMKFPGPLVVWGIMLFCPLLAAYFGIKIIRSRQNLPAGWLFTMFGGFLFIAFAVIIGIPLIIQIMIPETPKNPTTPRPFVA
jgi:hypothetical protein